MSKVRRMVFLAVALNQNKTINQIVRGSPWLKNMAEFGVDRYLHQLEKDGLVESDEGSTDLIYRLTDLGIHILKEIVIPS